jgi:hypothetical protein
MRMWTAAARRLLNFAAAFVIFSATRIHGI